MSTKSKHRIFELRYSALRFLTKPLRRDMQSRFLNYVFKDCAVAQGFRLRLLPDDHSVLASKLRRRGVWEKPLTNWIERNVNYGDVAVDIGANIGYFTLLLAQQVGASGRVFSFEASSRNHDVCDSNIIANGLNSIVKLENVAVGDRVGEINLYHDEQNSGAHSTVTKKGTSVEVVGLNRLDNLIPAELSVDFIKIDVEGGEKAVFDGMTRITQQENLTVVFEYSPLLMSANNQDPLDFLNSVSELGFELFTFSKSGTRQSAQSIHELTLHSDAKQVDVIATKKRKHTSL